MNQIIRYETVHRVMMINKKFFVIAGWLLSVFVAKAQKPSTFENWFSFSAQTKSNDFTFSIEEGWRIREFYMSRQNYTDLNAAYKINKYLQFSGGYRFVLRNSIFKINEVNHRLYMDATASYEVGDVDFSLRTRFQYTTLGQEDDIVLPSESFFRNRIKAKLKVNKEFSFSAAYEMLVILTPTIKLLTENRLSVEGQYKINKHNSVSLGYTFRSYIQVENPSNVNVVSLDYVFKF